MDVPQNGTQATEAKNTRKPKRVGAKQTTLEAGRPGGEAGTQERKVQAALFLPPWAPVFGASSFARPGGCFSLPPCRWRPEGALG